MKLLLRIIAAPLGFAVVAVGFLLAGPDGSGEPEPAASDVDYCAVFLAADPADLIAWLREDKGFTLRQARAALVKTELNVCGPGLLAERLVERYDCWTDDAPEPDVIPGHAIVTLPGGQPERVPSEVGFGIWQDGDPGTLHAFCK